MMSASTYVKFMVGAACIMGLCFWWAEPVCLRTHRETRHFPAYTFVSDLFGMPWIGTGIPISRTIPAHDGIVNICDQWKR